MVESQDPYDPNAPSTVAELPEEPRVIWQMLPEVAPVSILYTFLKGEDPVLDTTLMVPLEQLLVHPYVPIWLLLVATVGKSSRNHSTVSSKGLKLPPPPFTVTGLHCDSDALHTKACPSLGAALDTLRP